MPRSDPEAGSLVIDRRMFPGAGRVIQPLPPALLADPETCMQFILRLVASFSPPIGVMYVVPPGEQDDETRWH